MGPRRGMCFIAEVLKLLTVCGEKVGVDPQQWQAMYGTLLQALTRF